MVLLFSYRAKLSFKIIGIYIAQIEYRRLDFYLEEVKIGAQGVTDSPLCLISKPIYLVFLA